MNSASELLYGAAVFTKLDLWNASGQDQGGKTVFNTPLGPFKYIVMPFGLNASVILSFGK